MTERYVKASELERLADSLEGNTPEDSEWDCGYVSAQDSVARDLRSLIATAQPREVDDVAEREAFHAFLRRSDHRVTDWTRLGGNGDYQRVSVQLMWHAWLAAKRHERGEET